MKKKVPARESGCRGILPLESHSRMSDPMFRTFQYALVILHFFLLPTRHKTSYNGFESFKKIIELTNKEVIYGLYGLSRLWEKTA